MITISTGILIGVSCLVVGVGGTLLALAYVAGRIK